MGSQAIVTRIALIVMLVAGGAWIAPGTGAGAAPDPDLLGHWAFDEGAGPDAMESSGRGPEGEIHGAEWVKGRFGTALRFGGSGAYVTIPELRGLDGSDEMTLEAWVYWEATGRYPNIVSGGRWNPGGFLLFVSDDHCSFRMGKPGKEPFELGRDWAETGANIGRIVLGRWRHLAATFKRPKLTTYLDGEPVGSATWDYPVGFSGELRIGCWSSPNVCHTGLIDEVKIYRRALTPEEIRASYLKEAPRRQVAEGEAPYERIPVEATRLEPAVTLETRCARLWLDRKARVISLADKAAGKEYLADAVPIARLRTAESELRPTACSYRDGLLTLEFGQGEATATVKVTPRDHYLVFEVASTSGAAAEELIFLDLRVKPMPYTGNGSGLTADDEFAICLRALNLLAQPVFGGTPRRMSATCSRERGIIGARAALAACPTPQIRKTLQEMTRREGLPHSPLGGAFALDAPENRYSYLFTRNISEENVDLWILMARRAGIPYIHFSGWQKTLGSYEPRPTLFPNGFAGLKATIDKIHAAGLKASTHTLTGCISPTDPFASPVPDPHLAVRSTLTLAEDVDEKATTIPLAESPAGMDTIWAYASKGNAVRLGNEVVQFTGVREEPPYALTGCQRGAFGTKPAAHKKGAPVSYLYSWYGTFYPDPDSPLAERVADSIARAINECGFDMIYMDGAEGMPGARGYGAAKMRNTIFSKIRRPVRVEASNGPAHHSWTMHSCMGAWDIPHWGIKPFIDLHCKANESARTGELMPAQLGWWGILGPTEDYDALLPDEIEYLCAKALGWDQALSFQGVIPSQRPVNARQDEYLTLIGRYERLRLADYFSEDVRAKLREPGAEYHLVQSPEGEWYFLPRDYASRKVTRGEEWRVTNRYARQTPKLRVQALYAAGPYDGQSVTLADFTRPGEFGEPAAAEGVTISLEPSTEQVKAGTASGKLVATNRGKEARGAWARVTRTFSPPLDLRPYGGLGVWIYGDGKGEVLNFQLTNIRQFWEGGMTCSEHYVTVDFTGWRYFELLFRERDADRHRDYAWPYNPLYGIYRATLRRQYMPALNLYVNNVPPGETITCFISPIKALPVSKVKIANPAVTLGGQRVLFPVTLESGQSIEMESPAECRLLDDRGALVERFAPRGAVPALSPGENRVAFECDAVEGYRPRARITVIAEGPPLRGRAPREKVDERWLREEYDDPRLIRAIDGKENAWEIWCRQGTRGASLEAEIVVERLSPSQAGQSTEGARLIEGFEDLARFADSPENQFAKYAWDAEHQGVPAKPGVAQSLELATDVVKAGKASARFTATSTRSDHAGWCARGARFSPPLDLSGYAAVGWWIHGDAGGQALKLQWRDTAGRWLDLVTPVDFQGWRYVEFPLEARDGFDLSRVEYLILYFNGIPAGKRVTCHVDELRVLPRPAGLREPQLTVDGRTVRFPVALSAGERLVLDASGRARHYASDGRLVEVVKPSGSLPLLRPGRHQIAFGWGDKPAGDFQVKVMAVKIYR